MGDKYIIEKHEKDSIWRMYADAYGDVTVEGVDLTPYTEPDMEKIREEAYRQGYDTGYGTKVNEFYEQGLVDAWAIARKIAFNKPRGGLTYRELETIFGTDEMTEILDMSASDVIEKIRQYEQEQKQEEEQIQVGDEVVVDSGKCVVLAVDKNGFPAKLLEPDGYTLTLTTDVKLPKTGRYYPQIAEVLAKMKEES